jgi:hypothetical protein
MPGFKNAKELVEAELSGAHRISSWRKASSASPGIGFWFDVSMSPGNPSPQYYAATPLVSRRLAYSTDGGLVHGLPVSPAKKFLRRIIAQTSSPNTAPVSMILLDYLLYYPFIEMSTNDPQTLINSLALSRYTDGAGVRIMPVLVGAGAGGSNVSFVCSYTNSAGVAGRITRSTSITIRSQVGTIAHTQPNSSLGAIGGPFLPLQAGDSGVRSIQSITFTNLTDFGLITLVLVKPLAQASLLTIEAPVEIDYLIDFANLPEIKDDAYLNFIYSSGGIAGGSSIHGTIETIWG